MKKAFPLSLLVILFALAACAPQAVVPPTPLPSTQAAPATQAAATLAPSAAATLAPSTAAPTLAATSAPTEGSPASDLKTYTSSDFGLSFAYPATWFGPDEYINQDALRVAVGSDKVYPYGTDLADQVSTMPNSYAVVIQYTKNAQNEYWQNITKSLSKIQDGESIADRRSLVIKVRELKVGQFTGVEYISTLSESAQTEAVYIRQVFLVDDQSNVISIMGSPNNVEIGAEGWRAAYQKVDEANAAVFEQIVDSITKK